MTKIRIRDMFAQLPPYHLALCFTEHIQEAEFNVAETILIADTWDEIDAAISDFILNRFHEIIDFVDGFWIVKYELVVLNSHTNKLEWSLNLQWEHDLPTAGTQ